MDENEKDTLQYNIRGCKVCCEKQGDSTATCIDTSAQKFATYDWLEGIEDPEAYNIFEIQFKNTRKGFYDNVNNLRLKKGDIVAVEASPGHDIGIVSLCGNLVKRQIKKKGVDPLRYEFKKIYRKARPVDIEKWQEAIALEHSTMIKSRQIAAKLNLNMKIGDVEYQGDKTKAIFYYIADERVDFRELIKVLADAFHVRIEMRQIGARQEAGLIGGIGPCGRELCCAQWLGNFISVTTTSARHQDISSNPQKLAGQCCKLKCCLNYELDTYLDAIKDFPRINAPLELVDGQAFYVKSDILKHIMYFTYSNDKMGAQIPISVSRVKEFLALNKKGVKIEKLEDEITNPTQEKEKEFTNVVGEDSITRFDKNKRQKNKNNNNGNRNSKKTDRRRPNNNVNSEANTQNKPQNVRNNKVNNNNKPANNNNTNTPKSN